ncbi:MAG: 4Fe-4S dicluster domain-containing protein [Deltaproteobacteria bacterium]|nr:4Fe-4S dicluster domain-containing protein [Deltaproteobacteria bacterium]
MEDVSEKIQAIAARLLSENVVDCVIGFREGTIPLMAEPCLIRSADDAHLLVFNGFCGANLANYLPGLSGRIGITAKGCDSRNIVNHLLENQVKRENLYIIGVPCTGMADRRKLRSKAGRDVIDALDQGKTLGVSTASGEMSIPKKNVLQDNCVTCTHRNPVIFDEMATPPVPEQENADRFSDVNAVEAMSAAERWTHFEELIAGCIRCYACRNACPLCYCPTCFVDDSRPQWVGKSLDKTDTRTFHFLRAFHCAGRCTDCGACERACPLGIPVRQFTKKLVKDCEELYGFEAGVLPGVRPPLDTFRPDDPQEFIK